jgi:hypothetical protein
MRLFSLFIVAIVAMTQTTKADTIDFWHVYYNKIKIKEFNEYNIQDFIIKIDKIKRGDSITVKYFKDTHCFDCDTHLTIEDGKHHPVITLKGKGGGEGNPLSFALKDLLEFRKKNGCNSLEIFYGENANYKRPVPKFIFRIWFE